MPGFQPMQTGPGSGAPHTSLVNPGPGNKMAPAVVPSPQSRFMSVNSGVVQGSHPGSLQPSSPPAPARPSVAPAPPPTIQTVDTSKVPGKCSFYFIWLNPLTSVRLFPLLLPLNLGCLNMKRTSYHSLRSDQLITNGISYFNFPT